ncbi:MAG: cache domain-containing protein [Potamolinea sp.]
MDSAPIKKRSLSIRLKIPILIVTPLIIVVLLTGWLAYLNGRKAAEDLAEQLSSQISQEIGMQAQGYLRKPYLIHHTNAAVIRSGNLNVENLQQLERFFWHQIQQSELVNNTAFGNEQGEFVRVERDDESGKTVVMIRDKSTVTNRNIYQLDTRGNRTKLISSNNYDPRTRDWYKAAKESGKAAWSPIYKFSSKKMLGITPSMPIMDDTGKLRGVMGIDISLKQISEFLSKQEISKSGKAFIIERSGEIVASSIPETPLFTADKERINATDSSQPIIIQRTAQHLLKDLSNLGKIKEKPLISRFKIDGKEQLVNAIWLKNNWGLKWLIVVVIPESDFLENFNKAAIFTLFVGLSVTAAATFLGLLAARRIAKPISTITDAAAAIEEENFDPESLQVVAWREDELGQLARVFQHMAVNVSDRQQQLKQHVKELDLEIGKFKKERQTTGLKETHYLQDLLKKARNLRTPSK